MMIAGTQHTPQAATYALRSLIADFSIEATPRQIVATPALDTLLPSGSAVYVPFLPGADFSETADAVSRLAAAGYRPVPHLPVRRFEDRVQLAGWLARFRGAGAEALLLIAGDVSTPRGPFADTMAVLDSGLLERHGFRRIGVAGHPEGHPFADEATLDRALAHKAAYARDTGTEMWLVTQFTFAAVPIWRWLDRLGDADHGLPVRVGLAGPASIRTLLSYAMQCGVTVSARMLGRRPGMTRMLTGRWTPDEILHALARYRTSGRGPLDGIHVYPFGGLQRSVQWFRELHDGAASNGLSDQPASSGNKR